VLVALRDGRGQVVAESNADLSDLGQSWFRWSTTVQVPLDVTGGEGSVEVRWRVHADAEWGTLSQTLRIYA
jgi:hypothetical protein